MKKILMVGALFAVVSLNGQFVSAEIEEISKFRRGIVNVVTSPLEIPKQMFFCADSDQPCFFSGIFKGVVMTLGRAGSGVWDIATFNWDVPKNFGSLIQPDYVFDSEAPAQNQYMSMDKAEPVSAEQTAETPAAQ